MVKLIHISIRRNLYYIINLIIHYYLRKVDLIICGDRDQYFKDAKNKLARFSYAYLFPYSSHSLEKLLSKLLKGGYVQ